MIAKRNLELNDLAFLYYSAKACSDLFGLINNAFSELSQVVHEKICRVFSAFWHSISKREKRNEDFKWYFDSDQPASQQSTG